MMTSRLEQACQAPTAPLLPLRISAQACGWVHPAVLDCLAAAGCHFDRSENVVDVLPQAAGDPTVVSAWLLQAARCLHEAGLLKGWRGEQLDVLSEDGLCLGVIDRSAVRPFAFRTRAVHLNAWSPDGRLWVAQRAWDKNTDPGKWDTLVGGLVSAGESPRGAMLRESWEEAGLTSAQLDTARPVGTCRVQRPLPEGFQVEDVIVFDVVLDDGIAPCNQDGEVQGIELCDLDAVRHRLQSGVFTLEAELSLHLSLAAAGLDA